MVDTTTWSTTGSCSPREVVLDVRDTIRAFAPHSSNTRLLRWSSVLDNEDGTGVRVALLDSGICQTHPVFEGAAIRGHDFTDSGDLSDRTGHGTKDAALIVGQGWRGVRGLAPACELLFAKITGDGMRGTDERTIARGIRWAISEEADIMILPVGRTAGSATVAREIRRARKVGIAIFCAAGNRGADTFLFPARLRDVKAVSAADSDGIPLSWCCQAEAVNYYAPGYGIWSVGPGGVAPVSGSSPATVLAGGIAILWLAWLRIRIPANSQRNA
jgi:subtilisin family serine protease